MKLLGKFLHKNFAGSYLLQMKTIRALKCKSVLEIGPGEGFCARNLKTLGYKYDTVDKINKFKPTFNCSIYDLDYIALKNKYDIVAAFQMLEHIPYEDFTKYLKKLAIIAKKYVVISVPYSCKGIRTITEKWSGQFNRKEYSIKENFAPTNLPDRTDGPKGGHYWEIGRAGRTIDSVSETIEATGLKIIKNFHSPIPYHYFFVMEVF